MTHKQAARARAATLPGSLATVLPWLIALGIAVVVVPFLQAGAMLH
jgi:hypothetical protein